MKKLIAALLTAALLTLGLVEATSGASFAYTKKPCRVTVLGARSTRAGRTIPEHIRVTTGAKGKLTVRVTAPGGRVTVSSSKTVMLRNVKRGTYRIVVKFVGAAPTSHADGWGNAGAVAEVHVAKARK